MLIFFSKSVWFFKLKKSLLTFIIGCNHNGFIFKSVIFSEILKSGDSPRIFPALLLATFKL